MIGTLTTGNTTAGPFFPSDPGSQWQQHKWEAYLSGTFGGSTPSVAIEISPDGPNVASANRRWFSPASLTFTAGGSLWFEAKFRAVRYVLTGGDGTTSIVVEIV